jgi:hypothetical protein
VRSCIAAEQTGVVGDKEWLAVGDHRTRPSHLDIDGTIVSLLTMTFSVGDYTMNGPGDPNAGPEEVVNCRCVLLFHPGDDGGTTIDSGEATTASSLPLTVVREIGSAHGRRDDQGLMGSRFETKVLGR